MSETDDTDDLLLIPPDFFTHEAQLDLQPPYLTVFDSIITQVSRLEDRLDHIESASDLSFVNGSLADLSSTDRQMYHNEDRYLDSAQSTPQKPRTKFKLNSLPSSPTSDRFSPRRPKTNLFAPKSYSFKSSQDLDFGDSRNSRSKSAILSEIDEFISNVKTIERLDKERSRLDADDLSKLMNKLDRKNDATVKVSAWQCGDDANSIPDRGSGLKYILYKDREAKESSETKKGTETAASKPKDQHTSQKTLQTNSDSYITEEVRSVTSSEDTQTTAVHYVKSAPEVAQKADTQDSLTVTYKRDIKKNFPGTLPSETAKSSVPSLDSLRLLSLRDLWGQKESSAEVGGGERTKLLQKLEEEKLRRQHCEQLIQNLRMSTLELQERLAVALEVDGAKDEAIIKFHEAWENAVSELQNTQKEKTDLKAEIQSLNAKMRQITQEAAEKVSHYEQEISKALNIAHSAQQKLSTLEQQCGSFDNERRELENQYQIVQGKYETETEKVKRLTEILAQKEMELNENKNVLASARKEVLQSKKAVETCQEEFSSLKSECALLQVQINEKHKKILELESQKKRLTADIETHKKNEKIAQEELQKYKDNMEQHKAELRNFYQEQVESVVREKLREFQSQLDRAESLLQEEIKNKELSIAKTAALHIQSISEKHALEVQLLEEKHKEEVRLYQVQLSQNEQQIQNMQMKFQQQQERKGQLVQQLHKVMEAQWIEALKIINNSKSPLLPNSKDFSTIDQLNSLRSKSQLDFEELLSLNPNEQKMVKPEGHYATNKGGVDSTSSLIEEERGFQAYNEATPATSRPQKSKKQSEHELQKYIQMLLNKSSSEQSDQARTSENVPEPRAPWNSQPQEESKLAKISSRDRRLGKPPWK